MKRKFKIPRLLEGIDANTKLLSGSILILAYLAFGTYPIKGITGFENNAYLGPNTVLHFPRQGIAHTSSAPGWLSEARTGIALARP